MGFFGGRGVETKRELSDVRDQSDLCRYIILYTVFFHCMSWVSSPAFCHHSSEAAAVIVTKTIQVRLPNPLFCFLNTHEWGPAAEWTWYNQHFQGCQSNTSNNYDIDFLVDSRTGLMWSQEQPHGWSGELRCSTISPQALAHWWINNNHRGFRTLDIYTVFTHMTVKNNQLRGGGEGGDFSDDESWVLELCSTPVQNSSSGWEGREVYAVPHEDGWIGAC